MLDHPCYYGFLRNVLQRATSACHVSPNRIVYIETSRENRCNLLETRPQRREKSIRKLRTKTDFSVTLKLHKYAIRNGRDKYREIIAQFSLSLFLFLPLSVRLLLSLFLRAAITTSRDRIDGERRKRSCGKGCAKKGDRKREGGKGGREQARYRHPRRTLRSRLTTIVNTSAIRPSLVEDTERIGKGGRHR